MPEGARRIAQTPSAAVGTRQVAPHVGAGVEVDGFFEEDGGIAVGAVPQQQHPVVVEGL
jgi:hypothetical protein